MLAALLALAAAAAAAPRSRACATTSPWAPRPCRCTTCPPPLAHYEAALALDSTDYEANWRASLALLDQGEQIPDSIEEPRARLALRPRRSASRAAPWPPTPIGADGHFALAAAVGRASLTMGKKERIRRARIIRDEALRTIALDPRHDGAYHILGRWNAGDHAALGAEPLLREERSWAPASSSEASWEGAVSNMEKAVALDPGRLYHRLELAEIYVDRKRYDDARTQLAAARGAAGPRDHGQRLPSRGRGAGRQDRHEEVSHRCRGPGRPRAPGPASSRFRRRARSRRVLVPARSSPSAVSSRSRSSRRRRRRRAFSPLSGANISAIPAPSSAPKNIPAANPPSPRPVSAPRLLFRDTGVRSSSAIDSSVSAVQISDSPATYPYPGKRQPS